MKETEQYETPEHRRVKYGKETEKIKEQYERLDYETLENRSEKY